MLSSSHQPADAPGMNMLYDSEAFVVVHVPFHRPTSRHQFAHANMTVNSLQHGFEIVDKRVNREVFLSGDWATAFQNQINAWQQNTPAQEEVEQTLDGYCTLAQYPLVMH